MTGNYENAHSHTFSVVLSLSEIKTKENHIENFFYDLDQELQLFFDQYRFCYLNSLPEFITKVPSIENIGDFLYDKLFTLLKEKGIHLYQLDISDNPLSVYQVSDRILLPSTNMKESNHNYQMILKQKEQILALKKEERHDEN